jgi:hypothetical protein
MTIVPAGNVGALAEALRGWRDRLHSGEAPPPLGETERQRLSWAAYGRRYSAELLHTNAGTAQ